MFLSCMNAVYDIYVSRLGLRGALQQSNQQFSSRCYAVAGRSAVA